MAELTPGGPRLAAAGPAIAVAVAVLGTLAGLSLVKGPVSGPLVAAVLLGVLAVLRPAWGLLGYFIMAATLPSSEGISTAEMASFGLLGWLFVVASLTILRAPPRARLVRRLIASLYVTLLVLILNLTVARGHGIAFLDWARDVAPLANLCLLVILPAVIRHEKDVKLVRTAFVALVTFIGLNGVIGMVPGLHRISTPLRVGGTWVPALLVAAAAAGIYEASSSSWLYIAIGLLGIANAVTSTTRTVWVGVASVAVISIMVNLKMSPERLRRGAVVALFLAVAGPGLFLVWRSESSTEMQRYQRSRWASLSDLGEDNSTIIRREQVQEAMRRFTARPLLGEGLGYQYFYHVVFTDKYDTGTNYNHSDLANALCKLGLVGAIPLYAVLFLTIALCARLRRRAASAQDRWFAATAMVGIIGALIMGNSCPVLQERATTFLLSTLIGLVVVIAENDARREARQADEGEPDWARPLHRDRPGSAAGHPGAPHLRP